MEILWNAEMSQSVGRVGIRYGIIPGTKLIIFFHPTSTQTRTSTLVRVRAFDLVVGMHYMLVSRSRPISIPSDGTIDKKAKHSTIRFL